MNKHNCWEFKKCGREPGGVKINESGICPAATDTSSDGINRGKNGGRICWSVAGIFSKFINGTFAFKECSCVNCDFFRLVKEEEEGINNFILFKN
jgi:hypothetical protein